MYGRQTTEKLTAISMGWARFHFQA